MNNNSKTSSPKNSTTSSSSTTATINNTNTTTNTTTSAANTPTTLPLPFASPKPLPTLSSSSSSSNNNNNNNNNNSSSNTPVPIPFQQLPPKDPITCHVLDQTTGHPAASLSVSLTLLKPLGPSSPFTALTGADGRINRWNVQAGPSLDEIFRNLTEHTHGQMVWSLKFETSRYWGAGNTFFPEVEVRFFVEEGGGRYHVPLLLGPWSYSTYRGN